MRIIAGLARGRRLRAPKGSATRPATDRVREAVFSSLGGAIAEAEVLDLYAGSGSYGLEALSRGARAATFVESSSQAIAALRSNIAAVGLGGEVEHRTVRGYLEKADQRFDIVFMDPPWPIGTEVMEVELELLDRLLLPGSSVVVSRRHDDRVPEPPETWWVAANKRYGDTRIVRYAKPESDQ